MRQPLEERVQILPRFVRSHLELFDDLLDDLRNRPRSVDELQRGCCRTIQDERAFGHEEHGAPVGVVAKFDALAELEAALRVHLKTPHASAVASRMHHSTSHLKRNASTQRSSICGVVASSNTHASADSASRCASPMRFSK